MKVKIASAAIAPRVAGMMMSQRMRACPAPSSLAASSSSLGNADHELPHEKDAERARQRRHDHDLIVIEPAELPNPDVIRNEQNFVGDDERRDNDGEQEVSARKPHPREHVSSRDIDQYRENRPQRRHDKTIFERRDDIDAPRMVDHVLVILQA